MEHMSDTILNIHLLLEADLFLCYLFEKLDTDLKWF